jgi:hypothetical protein
MNQITIWSKDPNRIKLEEAEELAHALRALLTDYEILVKGREPMEEGRVGATWFQIIQIMVPAASIAGATVIQETRRLVLHGRKLGLHVAIIAEVHYTSRSMDQTVRS